MIGKYWAKIKAWKIHIAIVFLVTVMLISGMIAFFQLTAPYAKSKDGQKVEEPWAVMVGGQELFVVEDKEAGQAILDGVKEYYSADAEILKDVSIQPEATVVPKELQWGEETPEITEPAEAVSQVVYQNENSVPLLTVITTENVEKIKTIKFKTKYKESDELYEGEQELTVKGQDGRKVVTSQIIRENGKLVQEEVIDTEITQKAVPKIIHKGTRERPEPVTIPAAAAASEDEEESASVPEDSDNGNSDRDDSNYENTDGSNRDGDDSDNKGTSKNSNRNESKEDSNDKPVKDGDGQAVANYARRFIGNPYVYGGTSLTNGADCSGFVMSVYAHFGVSLPHSSGAIAGYGKGVSYRNAKPGDIVCYAGHVGIYIGGGKIVHASNPSDGIKISPATYNRIRTVRRIFD